jgi:hypothetical protein
MCANVDWAEIGGIAAKLKTNARVPARPETLKADNMIVLHNQMY